MLLKRYTTNFNFITSSTKLQCPTKSKRIQPFCVLKTARQKTACSKPQRTHTPPSQGRAHGTAECASSIQARQSSRQKTENTKKLQADLRTLSVLQFRCALRFFSVALVSSLKSVLPKEIREKTAWNYSSERTTNTIPENTRITHTAERREIRSPKHAAPNTKPHSKSAALFA